METLNTTLNYICPPGHYCRVQCPPGTNSSSTGYVTQKCLARHCCPSGTATLDCNILCPTGAHCPEGSPEPVICEAGSFQDEIGQPSCKVCLEDSYCLYNTTTPFVCPEGSCCPLGTHYANELLRPNDTYSDVTSLTHIENCTCTPGHNCGSRGLLARTAVCMEGKQVKSKLIEK